MATEFARRQKLVFPPGSRVHILWDQDNTGSTHACRESAMGSCRTLRPVGAPGKHSDWVHACRQSAMGSTFDQLERQVQTVPYSEPSSADRKGGWAFDWTGAQHQNNGGCVCVDCVYENVKRFFSPVEVEISVQERESASEAKITMRAVLCEAVNTARGHAFRAATARWNAEKANVTAHIAIGSRRR